MKPYRISLFAGLLTGLAASVLQAGTAPAPAMGTLINEYEADQRDLGAAWDLPGSRYRFDRLTALLLQWQARLQTVGFADLPTPEKIDWLLLRNDLERQQDDLVRDQQQWDEMAFLLPFQGDLTALELARLTGQPLDRRTAAASVARIPRLIKDHRTRIEAGQKADSNAVITVQSAPPSPLKVSAPLARRTARAVDRLRAMLKTWYTFHDGSTPDFSWWLKQPYEEADKSLVNYARFLREDIAGLKGKDEDPIVGEPLGATALAKALRHEFIAYDSEALLAIGERELAWGEQEMKRAARDMGLGDDWKAALARVKADYVAPGDQDALITGIAREAIAFTTARHLVTLPPLCAETWRLTMMPAETLKTIPYAAYNGQAMMVAYARDTMSQDDKLMTMQGNNRHFTRTVTPHELIPGHHLQRFMAQRHNRQRAGFSTPFYIEGWALYWERRFWDLGWATTPENRIGMLFWRMTRAARVIVTLKFHRGEMTPAGMADFLIQRVGHERLGAVAEARRFVDEGFSPLYQAGYLLGGLQLDALHRETVDQGLMTETAFHDAVLAENAIPIELIRANLLHRPLTPDFKPVWRFAESP